jgi:hypothetical protein
LQRRFIWDQDNWINMMATGAPLWQATDYRPADLDVAQLYDGFSFHVIAWLEALGICGLGGGGAFIEGASALRSAASCRSPRSGPAWRWLAAWLRLSS